MLKFFVINLLWCARTWFLYRTKFLYRTEVEHFGKFVAQMDETCNRKFQKFDDHCNKMFGRE